MQPLKLAVLTLGAADALYGQGIFNGDTLAIAVPTKVKNERLALKSLCQNTIFPLVDKMNFMALVDGSSSDLAQLAGATHSDFSESDVLSAVYRRYLEMQQQGMIIYPEQNPAAYQIPANTVNASRTPSGELRYEFDWARIRAEHLLTLMLVQGTALPAASRPGFIDAFRNYFRGEVESDGIDTAITHAGRALATIDQHFQERDRRTESMAGQQIDENSWYL